MRVWRKDQPVAVRGDFFKDIWITVIGFCVKVAAKRGFRIRFNDWKVVTVFEFHKKGFVIADYLGKEADNKYDGKYDKTIITSPVGLKFGPPPL